MKKNTIILISILTIVIGIIIGFKIFYNASIEESLKNEDLLINQPNNIVLQTVEIESNEEKTTPNTLIVYKTYYTKCKHYITKYDEVDASLVNLTEEEFKEKCKGWRIEKFSAEEIELLKEEEKFCNEHYKIILEDNAVVIYNIDENGLEKEYERTNITTEYLTQEDILKLTNGIYVFGKAELTATLEDYE